jgi:hypothetical protein
MRADWRGWDTANFTARPRMPGSAASGINALNAVIHLFTARRAAQHVRDDVRFTA